MRVHLLLVAFVTGCATPVVQAGGAESIAGVLSAGISKTDVDCRGGNIGVYAPIAKNLAFYARR